MKRHHHLPLAFLAALLLPGIASAQLIYRVEAKNPRLNRKVMGPVESTVQGVPAEPVDSFVWDGDGSTPIEGELVLEIDPVREVGGIIAKWSDENGKWRYTQSRFIHPEHSSGVRFGTSVTRIESLLNEGVTHNVYLHGDTTAGMPVLPTVFNYLATWGPADVLLDDQPFLNPYEIPAPQWLGHLMVTEGVRLPDGTVRTVDGQIYDPQRLTEGAIQTGDLEVHLVFHDERFPVTTNIPPIFSFFYHLVFEDVTITVTQADLPSSFDAGEEIGRAK